MSEAKLSPNSVNMLERIKAKQVRTSNTPKQEQEKRMRGSDEKMAISSPKVPQYEGSDEIIAMSNNLKVPLSEGSDDIMAESSPKVPQYEGPDEVTALSSSSKVPQLAKTNKDKGRAGDDQAMPKAPEGSKE